MLQGLRKTIRPVAGAAVGLTGLSIAFLPVINAVQANQSQPLNIPTAIATTYGINPAAGGGNIDWAKFLTTLIGPIVGGLIFIGGMRMIVKRL
jgi:hypothetical protein